MIISASRRTDIPSYYSDWFFRRLKEGYAYVRNPMNIHSVSNVSLHPDVVDGIVLWTKNPSPMLDHLSELSPYPYYFQFTLNAYQTDVEVGLPSKNDVLIPAFQRLSDMIGPDRVIWRYDPILLNEKYTFNYHVEYFAKIASKLKGYTKKCTISFIDYYRNTVNNVKGLHLLNMTENDKIAFAKALSQIARNNSMQIDTCAEEIDLSTYGVTHARCIDDKLLERISGFSLNIEKDKSQRLECGCISSIDIGMYNTCKNGCKYCYANYSAKTVETNSHKHDPFSPLISGSIDDTDIVKDRKVKSNKTTTQLNLFD
ncbi:DUF1848 domain-containing protein [Ruminococcaceae bacterium OttesenSCG-928-A11]|nr:DUF1848 domain-containing protein [Ruminococcaceae bacterium OttesenSCG-928-A11]